MWKMFKVNHEDTRTTSVVLLSLLLNLNIFSTLHFFDKKANLYQTLHGDDFLEIWSTSDRTELHHFMY